MMNTAIICSVLLFVTVSADVLEFDNNFIEYNPVPPPQTISLPYYPYNNNRDQTVVIESVPVIPVQTDTHDTIIVPTSTEVSTGFISSAISCVFGLAKSALSFLITNGPALLAGSAVALGICKLTSLCDSQVTIYEAQVELRSLATPERLSRAAEFLKEAVKKYNDMQNNSIN